MGFSGLEGLHINQADLVGAFGLAGIEQEAVIEAHAGAAVARHDVFEFVEALKVGAHLGHAPTDALAQFAPREAVMLPALGHLRFEGEAFDFIPEPAGLGGEFVEAAA